MPGMVTWIWRLSKTADKKTHHQRNHPGIEEFSSRMGCTVPQKAAPNDTAFDELRNYPLIRYLK